MTRNKWLASVAITALCCMPAVAFAEQAVSAEQTTSTNADLASQSTTETSADQLTDQATPAEQPAGADIVVTGSRVASDSRRSPTPLTVASSEQLVRANPVALAESVAQLPVFRGSSLPQGSASGANGAVGASFLNLRGLGEARTLVLLDGRRLGPTTTIGTTDVSLIPENLVKRVEVVTGGASAAYGSDAVAGVVNFILDDSLNGLRGTVQAGVSTYGDAGSQKVQLGFGKRLLDDRLHVLANVDYTRRSNVDGDRTGRDWVDRSPGILNNPIAGALPSRLISNNVTLSAAASGGLITSGPLRGTTFDVGGVPRPFNYGSNVGPVFMVGGEGPTVKNVFLIGSERLASFGRISFDATEKLTLFVDANLAKVTSDYDTFTVPFFNAASGFTIYADNAFLPSSIRTRMATAGVNSIAVGRFFSDLPKIGVKTKRSVQRYSGGFSYEFDPTWQFSAYAASSTTHIITQQPSNFVNRNLYAAVDAVVDGSGQVVCRSALTGVTPGCVPLNIFGLGSPSQAALDYVTETAERQTTLKQRVVAATLRGELPSPFANPIGLAVGAEYRKEIARQSVDPISGARADLTGIRGFPTSVNGQQGGFYVGNPQPLNGKYDVKEAFAEVQVPVLRDKPWAETLELNGAVRRTDYSTSGAVTTWKVGGVYAPFDGLRLRVTRSRDIRAPNNDELFSQGGQTLQTVRDPATGATVQFTGLLRGNPLLQPEKADTFTAGAVLQPGVFPGLTLSADFYDIKINGAIAVLTAQQTIDQCFQGDQESCNSIQNVGGALRLSLTPRNLAVARNRGLDFEAGYRHRLGEGDVSLRLLATRLLKAETQTLGLTAIDRVGEIGPLTAFGKWQGTLFAEYKAETFSISAQERYIGPGKYDATFVEGRDISDNSIPHRFYTDATVSFYVPDNGIEFFFSINNLFNQDPPAIPRAVGALQTPTNPNVYDVLGRYFTSGIRIRM